MSGTDGEDGKGSASGSTQAETLPEEVQAAIKGYADRLLDDLAACAIIGTQEPEAYLWHVRRSTEAICLLLLTLHERRVSVNPWEIEKPAHKGRGPTTEHRTLESIIEDLYVDKVIIAEKRTLMTTLRINSNPGVHLCGPKKPKYTGHTAAVKGTLLDLVAWLYKESPAAPCLTESEALLNLLATIKLDKGQGSPDAQIRLLQGELQVAKARIAELELGLDQEKTKQRKDRGGCLRRLTLVPLGALLVCSGLLFFFMREPGDSPRPETSTVPSEPQSTLLAASTAPAPILAPLAPIVTINPEPEPCPAGMLTLGATTVHLTQPRPRPTWPAAQPVTIEPIEVAPFCVDAAPRTWRALEGTDFANAAQPSCEGTPRDRDTARPAACLTRDEAESYCAAKIPGGRLPGIAEWEALLQSTESPVFERGIPREWVLDRFPPSVFNRQGASGNKGDGMFRDIQLRNRKPQDLTRWSWNQQPHDKRWENMGFRCARSITPTTP